MDTDQFDALAARAADHLTRRRSLGLAGALVAVMGLGLADEADAKKKKKKRRKKPKPGPVNPPTCTGCTACQTCVNGVCQARPEGSACGSAGRCINGFCARTCDPNGEGCPGTDGCQPLWGEDGSVCVPNGGNPCDGLEMCSVDATCDPGEACVAVICLQGRCAPVSAG